MQFVFIASLLPQICCTTVPILESSPQTTGSWYGGNKQRVNQEQPAEEPCWFGKFIR